MKEDVQVVIQCDGDGDPTVISAGINLSSRKTDNPVMIKDGDTDIAIMLLYNWNGEMSKIIFNSEKPKTAWSIGSACSNLKDKEHLLFVHTWSGCDTVLVTFGKRKASFLKLVNQNDELQDLPTSISEICDALRNLVPFLQFKKCEKHSWRSVNFSKVARTTSGQLKITLVDCLKLYLKLCILEKNKRINNSQVSFERAEIYQFNLNF